MTPEASYAPGAWVSTAHGLMKLMQATFPPHCKKMSTTSSSCDSEFGCRDDDDDERQECLLDKERLNEFVKKPDALLYDENATTWYSLGIWVGEDGRHEDIIYETLEDYVWLHPGTIPGTDALLIRMGDDSGMAYSLIFNSDKVTQVPLVIAPYLFVDTYASCVDDWSTVGWTDSHYDSDGSSIPRGSGVASSILLGIITTIVYMFG